MSAPVYKAIVVRQPWAQLIAMGTKTVETRPGPPNGPMRPDGVRGLPGLAIERGERIAIVAGADRSSITIRSELNYTPAPPFGAVVATAVVRAAHKIIPTPPYRDPGFVGRIADGERWRGPQRAIPGTDLAAAEFDRSLPREFISVGERLWYVERNDLDMAAHPMEDQRPLGDFAPGRWGWLLTDSEPCDPIPCKGRQGVFALPPDVAERLAAAVPARPAV